LAPEFAGDGFATVTLGEDGLVLDANGHVQYLSFGEDYVDQPVIATGIDSAGRIVLLGDGPGETVLRVRLPVRRPRTSSGHPAGPE
jgi:hypothetical protein